MKVVTGLLVGAAMLVSGVANAQYYSQASVSGVVLSYGPEGFMLQGPDGNYGIEVGPSTIITDPWNSLVMTGPGNVLPGDYVTATGFPVSQWVMQATTVVVRNGNAPVIYPSYYPPTVYPAGGVYQVPTTFNMNLNSMPNFNTLPTTLHNPFNP